MRTIIFALLFLVLRLEHANANDKIDPLRAACSVNPASTISIKASMDKLEACNKLVRQGRLKPDERADAYEQRAIAWSGLSNMDKAIPDFDEAIRLRPKEPRLLVGRAEAFRRKGQFTKAWTDLDHAVSLAPDRPGVYSLRGTAWLDVGQPARALDDSRQAIRINPNWIEGHILRGNALIEMGDFEQAIEAFNQAIALNPISGSGYGARARAEQLRGNLNAALADIRRALSRQPLHALWRAYEGDILRYIGDLDGALANFNNLIATTDQKFGYALVGRGLTYERKGDVAAARMDFERAVRQSSDLYDNAKSARETARSRLAALDMGAAPPVILPAPHKSANTTSLPTPDVTIRPQSPERLKVTSQMQGRRIALVIGNSNYLSVPELPNPRKDAEAVSTALRSVGFDQVTLVVDGTREKLLDTLRNFVADVAKADWAVVYYAGHGIEVSGRNYIIPIDARLKLDHDIQSETVALDQLFATIDNAKKLKLVILDACRDNPFAAKTESTVSRGAAERETSGDAVTGTRSIGRGLGEIKVASGSLVVFAAKHGQVALDGEGAHSPFTVAFLQRIGAPGIELNKIFRLVRDDVMEATAGRQEPYTYGSLPGREDFFFVEK